jgi:hypothetical protein
MGAPHLGRTAARSLARAGRVLRSMATKFTGHKTESSYRHDAIVSAPGLADRAKKLGSLLRADRTQDGNPVPLYGRRTSDAGRGQDTAPQSHGGTSLCPSENQRTKPPHRPSRTGQTEYAPDDFWTSLVLP